MELPILFRVQSRQGNITSSLQNIAVLYLISIVVPFLLCAGVSFSFFSELHTQLNTSALI
uniref:Uncharacterized protein n=1 Tax=Anguilla anguilla TaxID=7936 RepID=A0A0E9Y1E3_ANGAN